MHHSALSYKKYLSAEEAGLSVFKKIAIKMNGQLFTSSVTVSSIGINIYCICFHAGRMKIRDS